MKRFMAQCINKDTGEITEFNTKEFFGNMHLINNLLDTTNDCDNIVNVLRVCLIQLLEKYDISEETILSNIKHDLKVMKGQE